MPRTFSEAFEAMGLFPILVTSCANGHPVLEIWNPYTVRCVARHFTCNDWN